MERRGTNEYTIMIVEDNPADILLVREALHAHRVDCCLETHDNGERAVQALSRWEYDGATSLPNLVLLDWNLPTIGGADVLRAIRNRPQFHSVPVAILTSSGSPRDRAQALSLGATRFIQKPLGLDDFINQVGRQVRELLGLAA
jgi:CheY-like chemotaxis protein